MNQYEFRRNWIPRKNKLRARVQDKFESKLTMQFLISNYSSIEFYPNEKGKRYAAIK